MIMDNKTIELHTIATFQGKEYELENLLNGLLNKLEEKDKEIKRLNNIIERIDSFVDRTITVIEQQPTGNDEWILERLNGIKYLTELKEGKYESN